mgnify:CR=1 FL=1
MLQNIPIMIKVILLIDCASEFDRKLMRGIMKYSKGNGSWLFYRMPSNIYSGNEREEQVIKWAKKWKADAIIGRWNETKSSLLAELDIPVVLQNNRTRSSVYSNLTGDYEGTGKMAAEYFRKRFFINYAYYGVKDIIWSEERYHGFKSEVLKEKSNFFEYKEDPNSEEDRDKIMTWLKTLPPKTALFCCDDAHALFITETCRMMGIGIPDDIAVLGVDDDDLLCDISDPPISSIQLEVEEGGYQACRLLHQRLLSKSEKPFNVSIKPMGIKERLSTSVFNISDSHALNIIKYISDNYMNDISIPDILAHAPLSRRSIEMKFKNATGQTIYQYLISMRIEHLAYLLITTDRSPSELAYEVGFRDLNNIFRTFKKYKGCTVSEYRRRFNMI